MEIYEEPIFILDKREEEEKWNQYQEKTFHKPPHDILLKTLKNFNGFKGYSIDLGCGAGRDTIELLKNVKDEKDK